MLDKGLEINISLKLRGSVQGVKEICLYVQLNQLLGERATTGGMLVCTAWVSKEIVYNVM